MRLQDLHIDTDVYVGNRALPSVSNEFLNYFQVLLILSTSCPCSSVNFRFPRHVLSLYFILSKERTTRIGASAPIGAPIG